jgi:tetratricopeptide (TPR) repeat protein
MTLKLAKSLIVQSKFTRALNLLENIEKQNEDNVLELFENISLQRLIQRTIRNYPTLPAISQKIQFLFNKVQTEFPEIVKLNLIFTDFINDNTSLNSLLNSIDKFPQWIQQKIPLLLFRQIYEIADRRTYVFPINYEKLKQLHSIFQKFEDQVFLLEIYLEMIWTNIYRWKNDEALKLAQEYLKINEDLNNLYGITLAFGSIAVIYADMGDCKKSIDYSFEYLKYAKKLGVLNIIWHANFTLSLHYAYAADIEAALKYDIKCSELEKLPDFTDIDSVPTRNLITIHITWKKGDVDLALKQMLELFVQIESSKIPFSIAMACGVLADIYYQKGDLESAASYYEKGLKIREEYGAYTILANNYFHLLEIYLLQGMNEKALNYFDKIEKMKIETDEIWINQLHSLSKALILKSSKDVEKIIQAKKILIDLVSTEFPFQVTFDRAYLHLCDLILEEIKTSGNMELIEKIHNYIKELTLKATNIQSNLLIIELYFLQSKILLLDLKVEEALNVLEQALGLAREKGITRLEILLSNEYDVLLEQLDKWEDLTAYLPTLDDRFELTHIEDLLNGMIRKWISYSDIIQEEESPYLFAILDEDGSIVFSDSFSSEPHDYYRISEIFSKIKKIKIKNKLYQIPVRFRYHEFSGLFSKKQDFFFCYIFMGKSFKPIRKYTLFFDKFLNSSLLKKLTEIWLLERSLDFDIRAQLSSLIEHFFEN